MFVSVVDGCGLCFDLLQVDGVFLFCCGEVQWFCQLRRRVLLVSFLLCIFLNIVSRFGMLRFLCCLLEMFSIIWFWCSIIVCLFMFSVWCMLWVIIMVVSFFLVMICVVRCRMKLVVCGLSVVVCLLSNRICDGCSVVISRLMVWCWLLESRLMWLLRWFFRLRLRVVRFFWKLLCIDVCIVLLRL